MNKNERIVVYLGNDENFFQELGAFYKSATEDENSYVNTIIKISNDDRDVALDQFAKELIENVPHVVMIDFWDVSTNKKYIARLAKLLLLFKHHHELKTVPIFGIFCNSDEIYRLRYLFSCGIVYAHIKADYNGTLFEDSFYIGFEEKITFPKYAMGSHINLPYDIKHVTSVSELTVNAITVETDLKPEIDTEVESNFYLFKDFTPKKFDVSFINDSAMLYDYIYSVELYIPYSGGPWDEIDEDSFKKDTMETWLDFNKEFFQHSYGSVLIVNNNLETIYDFFRSDPVNKINIHYTSRLRRDFELIKNFKPDTIFYSFDDEEETSEKSKGIDDTTDEIYLKNTLNSMSQIINFIKTIDSYHPIILTFLNNSSSEALRKTFAYPSIISSAAPMNIKFMKTILESFLEKQINNGIGPAFQMKVTDPRRYVELKRNVIITSLTEHEVTFLSDDYLPYYTILKMEEPTDILVTVIPPIRTLENSADKTHYMGIIHSVDEERLQILRQFVNQIIFKKPNAFKFDREAFEEQEKEEMEKNMQQTAIQTDNTKQVKLDRIEVVRKIKHDKKSKL